MAQLVPIFVMAVIVLTFGAGLLFLFSLVGPKGRPSRAKNMPYECGIPGQEQTDTKVSVKFYLTAILFIIFDIEIIFMYPWAIAFTDFIREGKAPYILGSMLVFILVFIFGLYWAIKSNALEWE